MTPPNWRTKLSKKPPSGLRVVVALWWLFCVLMVVILVAGSGFASLYLEPCTGPRVGAKLYDDEYIFCVAEVKATPKKRSSTVKEL